MSCEFKTLKTDTELKYNLEVTKLSRECVQLEGGDSELRCFYAFDLMSEIEDPVCHFHCAYAATYYRPQDANMTWDQFSDGMALSHVIAYVREFVMNVTTRSTLPRLYIDPLNANALVARYERTMLKDEA